MIRHLRDIQARRQGEEVESGFTLIELLIVIVVIGILAATVVFALGNFSSTSASAACISDAKSYQVAVSAYSAANNGANPTLTSQISQYLHAPASNPNYEVFLSGDTMPTGITMAASPVAGTVYVGPSKNPTTLVSFDGETSSTGCNNPAV